MTEQTDTSTPVETGLDSAAAAFDNILTGKPSTKTSSKAPVVNDAEEDDSEAQHAEDDSTTPEESDEEAEGHHEEDAEEESEATDEEHEPEVIDPETSRATIKVKVDGKVVTVPVKDIAKSVMFQADYSRKTQSLAEERKRFESEVHGVKEERSHYAKLLTALEDNLKDFEVSDADWNRLWNENPNEYTRMKHIHDDRTAKLQAARSEKARLQQVANQEHQQAMSARRQAEWEKLIGNRPEWKDGQRWAKARDQIVDWGTKQGFSQSDLDSAGFDSRIIETMFKAAQYDALMANKPRPQVNQGKSAPAVLKPASKHATVKTTPEATKAKQRLARSGSVEDAASAFSHLFK